MIAVIIARAVPSRARGLIGRFLPEIAAGVFAGPSSARNLDWLWKGIVADLGDGSAVMIREDRTSEAGILIATAGEKAIGLIDLDGHVLPYIKGT